MHTAGGAPRYRLVRKIGQGGMGTVFLAEESSSSAKVALKFLSTSNRRLHAFFREEVRLLSRLSHPYLVKIFDYHEAAHGLLEGLHDEDSSFLSRPFFAMEYVAGTPLHALPRSLDPAEWIHLLVQVCEALSYLHARNILHRDLKPSNILLDSDGKPKILDFGLSTPSKNDKSEGPVRGTLSYMAPEVFWGEPDFRSDLFSLGVLFYECLSGRLPFSAPLMKGVVLAPRPFPTLRQELPEFFSDLIQRLLEPSPSRRPSSALNVLRFISQHREGTFSKNETEEAFLAKTPWVERKEFARFLQALDFSSPQRIFLKGPTGVGRTRLLEELKWHYQLEGIPFFLVPAPEAGEEFSASLKKAGFVTKTLSSEEENFDLGDLIAREGDTPRMMAFCDLHQWPEPHLKELMIFLKTASRAAPQLACILELNSDLPPPFVSEDEEKSSTITIELKDLSETEGRTLICQAASKDPPSEGEVQSILEASGGRPLFIVEALQQRLRKEDKDRFVIGSSGVSRRRVEQLSLGAKELLALIVSHSRPVLFSEAEALWRSSGSLLEDSLLELDERGFLAFRNTEHPELRLAQATLGKVFREALSKEMVLEAHRRWVEFLQSHLEPGAASSLETILLVEHGWEASDRTLLKAHGLRAAEAEIARGNESAAISWYERLLQHADTAVERYTCHALRAPLLYRQGRFEEALNAYDLWYHDREDDETLLQKVKYGFFTGLVHFAADREKEAEIRFKTALQTGDSERHEPLRYFHARALAFLSALEQRRGNFEGSDAYLMRGLKLARENPLLLGEMEQRLGELNQGSLRYDKAIAHLERSRAAYREAESRQAEAVALNSIALAQRERGKLREALSAIEEAVKMSRGGGQILQWARFLESRALIYEDLAKYALAHQDFQKSSEVLEVLGSASDRLLSQIRRAELSLRTGNLDRAEKIFKNLSLQWEGLRKVELGFEVLSKRAEGAYLYGDYPRAAELFKKALEMLKVKPPGYSHLVGHLGLCRSFARLGILGKESEILESTLALLDSVSQTPLFIWKTALRHLVQDLNDKSFSQGLNDFIARINTLPWPEMRCDLFGLFAAYLQRQGLQRTAQGLKELCRTEWNPIAQELTEELKMDFEKNRDPDALDLALSESLPRPRKKIPELPSREPANPALAPLSEARFRQYVEINRQLAQKYEIKEILERVMDAAIELSGAERGFLLLKEETPSDSPLAGYAVKTARNLSHQSLKQEEFKLSMSAVREAVEKGTPLLTLDAQGDSRLQSKTSILLYQIKSILVVPLEAEGETLGVIYLDHRSHSDCFKNEDMILITAFASQAALALQKAKMIEELQRAKGKLESQVEDQAAELRNLSADLKRKREQLRYGYEEIVGRSPALMKVFQLLDHVTETSIPVWIHGESGTGKELVARSLHFNSPRKNGPFITENVSAIPETLLESELFGHKKGAFTHADRDRIGLFEQASGGTLFLDEVADMSLAMQAKLLRVLQDGEVRPLGSSKKMKVSVRLVTASNKDLARMVEEEKFRQDLFFRINCLTIQLPSLRERKEDLPLLIDFLTKKIAKEFDLQRADLSKEALQRLLAHSWPGNIRELEGVLRNALLFAKGSTITPEILSLGSPRSKEPERQLPEREEVPAEERRLILEALRKKGMNKRLAAEEMGISLRSLYIRMERHGIPTHKPILAKFLGLKD